MRQMLASPSLHGSYLAQSNSKTSLWLSLSLKAPFFLSVCNSGFLGLHIQVRIILFGYMTVAYSFSAELLNEDWRK